MPSTQSRRKRALGKFLVGLREQANVKPEAVAKLLRKSTATVSRIENGHSLCDYTSLTAILRFYRASPSQRKQAEELWELARQDTSMGEPASAMPPKFRAFAKAWDEAKTARGLQQTLIPGPLQTLAYRASLFRQATLYIASPEDVERDQTLMAIRRKRLHGPAALDYAVTLDEAVVRRPVGGAAVMAEQLRHLLDLASLPNIAIRVIPFSAGEYEIMSGAVTWLGFAQRDYTDAVYIEYPRGGEWIEKADLVVKFAGAIEDAWELALTESESAELIRQQAEALERER